ncbi:MAG: hypothetical protein AUF65_00880 [Chloroflexi bacterium 13_1_20CM_50_12]|nr:MAG: hypothetical protein AUF65_00880 [Chloroflexi bacterium 13_1_20CM_50_12]
MDNTTKEVQTWDTIIQATDTSIADLTTSMYSDPTNIATYQRSITILMLRKLEAVIRKKMGEVMTKESFQELVEELAEHIKYLASDIEWYKVSPTEGCSERILSRTQNMHEALSEIENTVKMKKLENTI